MYVYKAVASSRAGRMRQPHIMPVSFYTCTAAEDCPPHLKNCWDGICVQTDGATYSGKKKHAATPKAPAPSHPGHVRASLHPSPRLRRKRPRPHLLGLRTPRYRGLPKLLENCALTTCCLSSPGTQTPRYRCGQPSARSWPRLTTSRTTPNGPWSREVAPKQRSGCSGRSQAKRSTCSPCMAHNAPNYRGTIFSNLLLLAFLSESIQRRQRGGNSAIMVS